ncbi:CBS domain-containing protein [Halobacteriales archaeon Cl-PHB]
MEGDVTVREVMNREYVGVSESDDLVETVELLLREEADTAVVLRGSDPVGVLTPKDVLSLLVQGPDPETADVGDAMTASVQTVSPDERLSGAADMMSTRDARRLVVTHANGTEPVGILTEHDVLAVRPFTRSQEPPADQPGEAEQATDVGRTAIATEAQTEAEDNYENQGICEVCGTLTTNLASFNGQLLCADCRDM